MDLLRLHRGGVASPPSPHILRLHFRRHLWRSSSPFVRIPTQRTLGVQIKRLRRWRRQRRFAYIQADVLSDSRKWCVARGTNILRAENGTYHPRPGALCWFLASLETFVCLPNAFRLVYVCAPASLHFTPEPALCSSRRRTSTALTLASNRHFRINSQRARYFVRCLPGWRLLN